MPLLASNFFQPADVVLPGAFRFRLPLGFTTSMIYSG
jgi:hypothetical protein